MREDAIVSMTNEGQEADDVEKRKRDEKERRGKWRDCLFDCCFNFFGGVNILSDTERKGGEKHFVLESDDQ